MKTITCVKGKSIDEIDDLRSTSVFKLSNLSMHQAFQENDIEKLKYLKQTFGLTLPDNGSYHVDCATENGDFYMVEYLITNFSCFPTIYAKQMAMVNGHVGLVDWLIQHGYQRYDVGYKYYDKETGEVINIG